MLVFYRIQYIKHEAMYPSIAGDELFVTNAERGAGEIDTDPCLQYDQAAGSHIPGMEL